ncbi:ATP-binding protein, partial [Candidatus Parcubacteria bacterium]
LAQSLLGLAETLRDRNVSQSGIHYHAELVRLTIHGLSLIALSDPWAREWGGRYGALLEEAYFLLDDVLLQAEQQSVSSAERSLFAFLHHWYGMYAEKGENFIRRWHQVLEAGMNVPKDDAAWPDVGTLQQVISHFADPSQRFEFVETQGDSLLISEKFVELVQKWSETHRYIGERLTLEFLDSQLKKCRNLRRSVYALPHEQRVLRHFIDQDIRELERLRAALRGKVVLQARLLTNPILLDSWTQLVVEIQNVGAHPAHNLNFELVTAGPGLLEKVGGANLTLSVLPARSDWHRLSWRIRLKEEPGVLELVCRFEEDAEKREVRFSLPVNVLRRAGKGQRPQGGNRFQAGIPVSGRQFFGRERELKIIFDFLLGDIRQPVILRGPRRIGKTSILHQIEYLLKQEGELQRLLGYSREEEAYIRRFRPVSTSLQKIQGEEGLSRWLFQLYRGMAETVGEKVEIPANEFQAEPFFVFEDLLSQSLFPRFPEARWLILLDEWDEGRHVHGLPGKLRALMQRADFTQLQWVFASTWMLSEEAGRFGSPFFSQCKAIELSALTWKDARRLVLEISRKMNVEWEGAALLRLLDQTALRPYLIQRVGQDVIQHLSDSQPPSNFVDLETLDTVLSKVIRATSDPTSPFAFLWPEKSKGLKDVQETRLTGLGRMILLGLSEEKRPLTLREIVQSLQRHLLQRGWEFPGNDLDVSVSENLINLGRIFDVIARQPDKRFAFSIPLAQAWFEQRVQSIEDPWQVAWEQLCQEYRVRRSAKEAQE